jgi:hypothetical protein
MGRASRGFFVGLGFRRRFRSSRPDSFFERVLRRARRRALSLLGQVSVIKATDVDSFSRVRNRVSRHCNPFEQNGLESVYPVPG